jgi:hypothetical protein
MPSLDVAVPTDVPATGKCNEQLDKYGTWCKYFFENERMYNTYKIQNYTVLIMMVNSKIIQTSEKYWFEQPSIAYLQMDDA